ncbi:MAG: hypothetical protein ACTS1X_00660 [Parasphingopyxis sp.]|uniref:hypothetical protein n=1 Tax=Parasphingopyxis sp. TaxID=1920299 RepID=UPI003F9FFF61
MAFGIDDALTAATVGIKLTDTVVRTIKRYRKQGQDIDIELLIEEVRTTALQKIEEADHALFEFESMLKRRNLNLELPMNDVVLQARWWNPVEQIQLKNIRAKFNAFSASVYDATDDIAALLRCRDQTTEMGVSVVESVEAKHELSRALLDSPSVQHSINLLREKLKEHKIALM